MSEPEEDEAVLRPPGDQNGNQGGSFRKGSDPLSQTQRSKLQHRRARINQQINKEMRMRAGAENLFRATNNHKVKETVALELSFVNSNLQLLKEELEELNSSVEVYQTDSESISVPMIPLGLKETKEVDLTTALKDYICEHYGEEGSLYDNEIAELMDLRQAMRTPSRNEAGLDLLMEYYNQLYFLDNRFIPPNKNLGVYFHWYDSLTGVPSCQRALAFEKGSVLFNIGALFTQIGARQDRANAQGIENAIDAFQKAAGAFNYLKENFSNAPSLDMSVPSLNMLVRLMIAQVQECVFEKVVLLLLSDNFLAYLKVAQEAARVADVYSLVYQTMTQPPVKDYVPFSWVTMVQVKSEHFKALSHYYAAVAFCDSEVQDVDNMHEIEKALIQFHITMPEGPSLSVVIQDLEERRKLGKAHLKKAIIKHEEAMRIHSLCKTLRKIDILQEVLSFTHKRSLNKYSEIDHEDDFFETGEAPDIHPKTQQKPEIKTPNFSRVKVTDIFHRLGPLSVFSAKNKWSPPRKMRLVKGEGGFGFTLRGDSPILIAGVVPNGSAANAGLREGDYIISINGQDCKWSKHAEVVQMLKGISEEGVDISVITVHMLDQQSQMDRKSILLTSTGSLSSDKENIRCHGLSNTTINTSSLLPWNKKKTNGRSKKTTDSNSKRSSSAFNLPFATFRESEAMY
ncbi:rhophilin-1 [Polypterus senegalus]|uniref:rhophilin-1 n=1 Tax=Polypterus senegalus TaxID=55291 RepID=UPI0019631995|nr:rhophilin-1 [Polypterus senegalus]